MSGGVDSSEAARRATASDGPGGAVIDRGVALDKAVPDPLHDLVDSLDETVPEVLRMTGAPGLSLAVAPDDGPVLVRAWGWHDIAARRPLTPASVFAAGSITKLYTAVAVMQLVERGTIGLHDPVNAHLTGVRCDNPFGAREVTVYDLLTFRSGLAVDTTASSLATPPPLLDHLRASYAEPHGREYAGTVPRWNSPVGERYHYANLGISTLGLLVEQRNPERLDLPTYLARHVIAPLGMTSAWLSRWDGPVRDRATGYAVFSGLALPSPPIRSADHPANGLQTTPADHVRMLCALGAGGAGVLRPETVRLMLTPQVRMDEGDGLWPGSEWWTGLVAIMSNLGREDAHFGHPGSHMWGWWCVSRAYPRLGFAAAVFANGWDMLRWHNPANRDATAIVMDLIADWHADGQRLRDRGRSWAWKRAYAAGAILAERTAGSLGVAQPLDDRTVEGMLAGARASDFDPDGFRAAIRDAGPAPMDGARAGDALRRGVPAEQVESLLQDLGMVYGHPVPLWFWHGDRPGAPA